MDGVGETVVPIAEALHWYAVIKALRILVERGGSAPVDEVTRAVAEESGDAVLAEAWVEAAARRRLVVVEGGVARLTEEGREWLAGEARRVAERVKLKLLALGLDL